MMDWIDEDLADRHKQGLYRSRRRIESGQGVHIQYRGRTFLNFSSNDYLNLTSDPRLARAAACAARRYGTGAGASPLVSGHSPPHRALERALARWEETEAALVFSSGFMANVGVLGALADPDTVIFSDELNHASLIDGCRLARARTVVYRHGDANHLVDLLVHETQARRRLIVTDTVFSMDGDFAPLADLLDLAQRFDCLLVIDEAHATGVLGEDGRGLHHSPLTTHRVPFVIKIGTLSKALGAQGGFVCGSKQLIHWLVNRARPYIFSTALAPPTAAAARRAIGIVQSEPQRRRHLLDLADQLRQGLRDLGQLENSSRCQIVPVMVGNARAAVELSNQLEEHGLLVPAIRPPSVPDGTSRLRISLTAGHSAEEVRRLIDSLQALGITDTASSAGRSMLPKRSRST
jgi:8-amino-7-oxononanoate synthase